MFTYIIHAQSVQYAQMLGIKMTINNISYFISTGHLLIRETANKLL